MTKDTKIEISVGCTDYLVEEVEALRRKNELLGVQVGVMDNFFSMINRLGAKPSQGFERDRLWDAKSEIAKAIEEAKES